jgi:hypothetical protein
LLDAYSNWGIKYIAFFDKPNQRASWPNVGWTQRGLVTRFLELFSPIAKSTIDAGMCPIFPPLEAGGDYWDTAFLRAALEELDSNGESEILEGMAIGAYAYSNGKALDWGAGGPERWPSSVPYSTPEGSQDQRGFRIFDWYNAISKATIGREIPIMVLAAGSSPDANDEDEGNPLKMAKQVAQPKKSGFSKDLEVPSNVLAVNFWLLAEEQDGKFANSCWFDNSGKANAQAVRWLAWKSDSNFFEVEEIPSKPSDTKTEGPQKNEQKHYLLLPTYKWGKSKRHVEIIKPFVEKHSPIVGYSLSQARKSARVTIVGGSHMFTEDILQLLRNSGCEIKHILGDGTQIAYQLAEL